MSHIPFDVLMKTRETMGASHPGKRGAAGAPKKLRGRGESSKAAAAAEEAGEVDDPEEAEPSRKKGKHMPKEISSKRTYNPFRESKEEAKRRTRDPRFDRLGDKDSRVSERARKNYSFVFDEVIPEEEKNLKASMKKLKGENSKQRIQNKLKKLQRQVDHHKSEKRRAETRRNVLKASSVGSSKSGKKFYLKKSEMKKQLLLGKFNELKKQGKLEDYLAKKRRRNASKEHKSIPFSRRQDRY